ncbi:MAG: hypothetical protein Q4B42_05690 [Oscillospiraceae bacterium]|nr:hypothetical protein [Oscillospiraceae bacterium]
MKKSIRLIFALLLSLSLTACGGQESDTPTAVAEVIESGIQSESAASAPESSSEAASKEAAAASASLDAAGEIDIDLSTMGSTMVYAEVYNMMMSPEDYVGKTVKARGQFAVYEDSSTGAVYLAVLIADATACCSQGLEFVLEGGFEYPADYPEQGTLISVAGRFETYEERGFIYCHLVDAYMVLE